MYRTLDDFGDRYIVVPAEEGVSLATLGVLPYSPPDPAWEDDDRMPAAPDMEAPGISFADLVRPISPVAEPGVWRDDNIAPFWSPDAPRAISGPSFDDLVRTIDSRANPDVWRDESTTPQYARWDSAESYAVPYDPRAAGAFVEAINPTADAAVWGEGNVAPFWHIDDPYAPSAGVSFDDLVRTIPSTADPDIWPRDSAPLNVGHAWDGASASASERYAVPPDRTRAAALGVFEIPGLPDDAAWWRLNEPTLAGADGISLAELESEEKRRIIDLFREPAAAILRALIMRRFGGRLPPRPGPQPGQPKPGAPKPADQPASKSSTRGGPAEPGSTTTRDILAPGGQPIGTRHRGASDEVRTTSSPHFDEIYSELKSGSKPAEPPRHYDGSAFERFDGIVIGERVSEQHGRTLEVLRSNDPLLPQGFKVHQR